MKIVTLSNGKKVANFSSPHDFKFVDGSILPAVHEQVANLLQVTFHEEMDTNGDVKLSFSLSDYVLETISFWKGVYYLTGEVDVVFCPLPMITSLKEIYGESWLKDSPFRAIRIEDRINKLVSIDKQCI